MKTVPEKDIVSLQNENAELRLQLRKLNRQNKTLQNTITRFEKVAAAKDKLTSLMRSERFRQAQYLNVVFENSQDVIIFLDAESHLVFCTPVFLDVTGIDSFEQIDGVHIKDVLSAFMDISALEEALDRVQNGKDINSLILENIIFAGKNAELVLTIHISVTYYADGKIDRILLVCHDVTALHRARDAAEAANRAKSAFLATVSHEIRTPLNAIIGLSEIQLQKQLPDETHSAFEKILNSGSNLLNIVNEVLDFSKIETGNLEIIPVKYYIPSLINDVVHLNMVLKGEKLIAFKLKVDPTLPNELYGDELRLKQVLNNVLSNAFKYTKEGKIVFTVSWEKEDDHALFTFKVSDTGVGIRASDMEKLFVEYSQLDTKANRKIEGTGLGLAISKRLIELMGGTISAESKYGKGSTFTVSLRQKILDKTPIGKKIVKDLESFHYMEAKLSQSKALVRNLMPYGKVLVVDDVATNLEVAKGLLAPYGLTVDCVLSGADAVNIMRVGQVRYDAIFMDHMMPNMDGIETVRIIRNDIDDTHAKTVPIIALTANALAGNEKMFLESGFNSFISKPIDIMRLDVVLNQFVRNKQSEMIESADVGAEEKTMGETLSLKSVNIDGLDIAAGIQRYGQEAVYAKILASYALHTPKLLDKLRNPSLENLSEYAITVHGLKGASLGICANTVGKKAEALEFAAKANDLEKVNANNETFIKTTEKLLQDLNLFLNKSSGDSADKQKLPAPDRKLLSDMLNAAVNFKPLVMEEIITQFEKYDYESDAELVSWLREQTENLEYDAIRERLESIL